MKMTPTHAEKMEWSRLAQAAYGSDLNDIGHRFSAAAALRNGEEMEIATFDTLQSYYRAWLVSGFPVTLPDCTMAFAEPGSDSLIDCIHPITGRSCINGETLEQIRLRYPKAEIVSIADYCAAKAARQDSEIEWLPSTAEKFNEMLEVLPPALWERGGFLVGEPWDHHAGTGAPRFAAHVERHGKYYEASRPMTRAEFRACDFSTIAGRALIACAAEASEEIGEDELERHALTMSGS